jgi:site-specific DNA-methyltransferase (adenine-specific)
MIAWLYGTGFPKSLDVSKAIDKAAGAEREVVGQRKKLQSYGANVNDVYGGGPDKSGVQIITAPATEAARQWAGWGTALKPALEPITVARKPLIGTVAENVLAHGTGALNVDGCRVAHGDDVDLSAVQRTSQNGRPEAWRINKAQNGREIQTYKTAGRWPANLIHDGSEEVVGLFPQAKGQQGAVGPQYGAKVSVNAYGDYGPRDDFQPRGDSGSAARFFYCAKASKADREANNSHPTVKPTDLMRYLCRLVTPPGGTVLDPFMGSGSTGAAAMLEGFQFIGIEREAEYVAIARERIESRKDLFSV